MAEEKKPTWLRPEKMKSWRYPMELNIGQDQQTRVRIIDDTPWTELYRHTSGADGFMKALCTATFDNASLCPLCVVNNHPAFAGSGDKKVENSDLPYPKGRDCVKAVWVYDLNEPRLLIGVRVWEAIEALVTLGMDVLGRDISIGRTGKGLSTQYQPVLLDASPRPDMSGAKVPDAITYKEALRNNIRLITMIRPEDYRVAQKVDGVATTMTEAVGGIRPQPTPVVSTPVVSTPAAAPAAAPVTAPALVMDGVTGDRIKMAKEFSGLLAKRAIPLDTVAEGMDRINKARKAMGLDGINELNKLSDEEYGDFLNYCKKVAASKGA